jgi:hypothetical protein
MFEYSGSYVRGEGSKVVPKCLLELPSTPHSREAVRSTDALARFQLYMPRKFTGPLTPDSCVCDFCIRSRFAIRTSEPSGQAKGFVRPGQSSRTIPEVQSTIHVTYRLPSFYENIVKNCTNYAHRLHGDFIARVRQNSACHCVRLSTQPTRAFRDRITTPRNRNF